MRPKPSSAARLCRGAFACALVFALSANAAITTESLISEMTDLRGMAEFPDPAYTCKQFSSYDPKSKSPQQDWFANGDAGHYLRVEDRNGHKEYVMMDAKGPGAVVRIWSANPAGNVRIYIDGTDTPVVEAPLSDLLGGKFAGLPRPISGEYSKGWNLYFPIPYAKQCKITSDKGGFYYHVNYRTYTPGTAVESFRMQQIEALRTSIQQLAARLAEPQGNGAGFKGRTEAFNWDVPAGETIRREIRGASAIERIVASVAAGNMNAALRGTILKISFDGEPCVEAPLGDFFGTAPGLNAFAALPVGVAKSGQMYCHWYMPFKELAVVELSNTTRENVAVNGSYGVVEHAWSERSMHFHAKWRAQFDVPTRPMIDWNYLTTHGKGVFAGVAFAIDNPVKDWWGEGDEKIYVDGETFPSHFGTGTEDYYGYAWCWPGLFTHAYHSQPRCDGPANYGRTSVNRFHIADRIPFNKDFKFDMELWHWHQSCTVNMAVTAYWYAQPGASDAFKPISPQDAIVRPMAPYIPPHVAGAIEGEDMKPARVTGIATPQDWAGISGDKHLWWHAGMTKGDTLAVTFPAPKAGRYRVIGRFLTAKDYGVHQLAVNGLKAGQPIDFYNPEVKPTKERDLGVFDLKAGDNEFSATVVGANDKAVKSYMFGLDYLLLKPQ